MLTNERSSISRVQMINSGFPTIVFTNPITLTHVSIYYTNYRLINKNMLERTGRTSSHRRAHRRDLTELISVHVSRPLSMQYVLCLYTRIIRELAIHMFVTRLHTYTHTLTMRTHQARSPMRLYSAISIVSL